MTDRAVVTLFLDVDGVLSPIGGPSSAWDDWEAAHHRGYHLLLSRAMAERIAALPVRIVWLTTWRELANTHICPWLGWKTHDVVDPGYDADAERWKAEAVRAHIESDGGPFVWIDDMLDFMTPQVAGVLANHRHLLIAPDSYVGLTRHHLDEVEAFLLGLEG